MLVALTACATAVRRDYERQITVRVRNDNQSTVIVYSIDAGQPDRLGSVGSFGSEVLYLRVPPPSGLYLAVGFPGGGVGWSSGHLFWIEGGDCVELQVASSVAFTTAQPCHPSQPSPPGGQAGRGRAYPRDS